MTATTLTIDEDDVLIVAHVNRDKGYRFSEYDQPLHECYFAERVDSAEDRWTVSLGDIYRECQSEYGRCEGKVYVDPAGGGPPQTVGWVFVSREQYEDTGGPYLRETWVTLARKTPPVPARFTHRTIR